MAKRVRSGAKQLRLNMSAKLGRPVTLDEVAQKTGIEASSLSRIENNKIRGMQFETLEKLAEFYGLSSVDPLLPIEDQIQKPGRRRAASLATA